MGIVELKWMECVVAGVLLVLWLVCVHRRRLSLTSSIVLSTGYLILSISASCIASIHYSVYPSLGRLSLWVSGRFIQEMALLSLIVAVIRVVVPPKAKVWILFLIGFKFVLDCFFILRFPHAEIISLATILIFLCILALFARRGFDTYLYILGCILYSFSLLLGPNLASTGFRIGALVCFAWAAYKQFVALVPLNSKDSR